LSFLPREDENHSYVQAPYEEIDEESYERLSLSMPEINWDFLSLYELEDTTTGSQTLACMAGQCDVSDLLTEVKETVSV
jgi:ribonucleoside-diphosphate reductase alpha chain